MKKLWAKKSGKIHSKPRRYVYDLDFMDLSPETRKDYTKYSGKVLPVFGKTDPNKIKPEHIRRYMDQRGISSRTQANREKSFLSRVFRWGYERGYVKEIHVRGLSNSRRYRASATSRMKNTKRFMRLGLMWSVPAMEIAYLCVARQSDVLSLSEDQISEMGIFIRQGKTGVKQIKAWTPRLRAAVSLARALPLKPGIRSLFVIHQPVEANTPVMVLIRAGARQNSQPRKSTLTCRLISLSTI
jgi:hypothetical protein